MPEVTMDAPSLGPGLTVTVDTDTRFGRLLARQLGAEKIAATRDDQQSDIEHDALGVDPDNAARVGGIAADRLRSIIERVERLEEERKSLSSDIKDILTTEAKSAGFDAKVIRQIIKIRKIEPAEVEEQELLLDTYRRALGM